MYIYINYIIYIKIVSYNKYYLKKNNLLCITIYYIFYKNKNIITADRWTSDRPACFLGLWAFGFRNYSFVRKAIQPDLSYVWSALLTSSLYSDLGTTREFLPTKKLRPHAAQKTWRSSSSPTTQVAWHWGHVVNSTWGSSCLRTVAKRCHLL